MDLRAAHLIHPKIEGHYAYFSFVEQISTQKHHHDFYEIFLIKTGEIIHHINGEAILLRAGALVFIRPSDTHYYQPNADHQCTLINLAYLRETFLALSDYLGLATKVDLLLQPHLPPTIMLTATETTQLSAHLQDWGRLMTHDIARSRLTLRALLAQIISRYFIDRVEDYPADVPRWLVELCQQLRQKPHVIEGRDAMLRLANRTPEHLGRVFKTYLGVTPSEFINNARLDYASDLLLNTDMNVTDICFEVGFENVSHFYRLFKTRWNCTPQQFRKTNRRTLIP